MVLSILEILERGMSAYCESGIGLFDTQPINTISNIMIIIFAYFSYNLVKIYRIKNSTIRMLPLIAVLTGVGSMFWHGMPGPFTRWADTLPISLFLLVSFFYLLNRILPNRGLVWGTLFVFVLIEIPFIFGILPSFNGFISYLIALVFGLFVFFGLARKYNTLLSQLIPIVILFITAFFFRTIDFTTCSAFPLGTHFMWHVIIGVTFYFFIRLLVKIEKKRIGTK